MVSKVIGEEIKKERNKKTIKSEDNDSGEK